MPRNGSGVYSLPAGSTVANGDTSDATDINTPLADLVTDANTARPIVAGGTGATSASAARTALAVPGKAASETITGDWTVSGDWTISGNPAFSGSPDFSGIANASTVRTDLGLEIGADVQGYDAGLQSIAGLSTTQGDILYNTSFNNYAVLDIGTAGQVLTVNSGATAPEWADVDWDGVEVSSVATTSGTTIDLITGLPAGVRRIELYWSSVSTSTLDNFVVQIGSASGWKTTGYDTGAGNGAAGITPTNGFPVVNSGNSSTHSGIMTLVKAPGGNVWHETHDIRVGTGGGAADLAAAITRVRITGTGGTAVFDGGGISARYWV